MENEPKKEMTLADLAVIVKDGFEKSEIMTDEKIEGLAQIISKSFDKVEKDLSELKIDVSELKTDVHALKNDVSEIKTSMQNLEADMNKKVDKVDHNTLIYRVEKLEKLSKKYA